MSKIYTSMDQMIGRTPLLELCRIQYSWGWKPGCWQSWNT